MAAITRPYSIRAAETRDLVAIVRAASPAAALRHYCRGIYSVTAASVDDAFEAADAGIELIHASAEDSPGAPADQEP